MSNRDDWRVIWVGWRSFEGWGLPFEAWSRRVDGSWEARGRRLTWRRAAKLAKSPGG